MRCYLILVGRVQSIAGNVRLDENTNRYNYLGEGTQRGKMNEVGLFVQDSWRWKPNVTLNYGLRYELQMPFYPTNDAYATATIAMFAASRARIRTRSAISFQPNVLTGTRPTFIGYSKGTKVFETTATTSHRPSA